MPQTSKNEYRATLCKRARYSCFVKGKKYSHRYDNFNRWQMDLVRALAKQELLNWKRVIEEL